VRKILHIDMDAFYAAVEQRDNPLLKGRPVIVGGRQKSGGSFPPPPMKPAFLGFIRHARFPGQKALSSGGFPPGAHGPVPRGLRADFRDLPEYTPLIEPLSLDESFLDVTGCESLFARRRRWPGRSRKKS